jgi:hypothetical protein
MNNSGTGVILALDATVSGTLTLTNGIIETGANVFIVSPTSPGSISGGSVASYVGGNLQRGIASGSNTYAFPIGSTTTYAPVTLAFQGGTNSGTLIGATYDGDHPGISNSILYEPSSINRYWIFAVQSGMGNVNYSGTFNWAVSDEDASFDDQTSQVGKFTNPVWSYPTIGTQTASSVQILNGTSFSDFQVSSCAEPSVSDQPDDITVCEATSAQLSVTANGPGDITYQWYKTGSGALSNGGNISGATSSTLIINPSNLTDSGDFYVIVTRECSSTITSSEASLAVLNSITYGTVAPGDETICSAGDPVNISFVTQPSGGTGGFTYQWYYKDGLVSCPSGTSTSGWTIIGTATNSSYDPPAGLLTSRTYAVVVDAIGSPDCGIATWATNCRQVTINDVSGGTIDADQTICSGGDPDAFTVILAATGSGVLTYQWQSSSTDCATGFTDILGATDATYDVPDGLADTTYYRRVVTSTLNSMACTAMSNCVTVLINNVSGGTVDMDQTICAGGDPDAFTVMVASTGSGAMTYQWQSSMTDCSTGFTDISGATDATYDVSGGLTDTTYYRRVVTSTLNGIACSALSNCVTVLINNVSGGTVDADQTICFGGDPGAFTITVASTGSGALTYQWQSSATDCGTGFTDVSGATDATFDVPGGLTDTTYYRRVVTSTLNGIVCTALSNCVTELSNNVRGGTIVTDQTICSGGDPDGIGFARDRPGGLFYCGSC